MRRYAITVAVAGFFMLATVGCCCGVELLTCAMRALAGAVALYVMTRIAAGIVIGILADTMVRSRNARETSRDHRNA